MTNKETDFALCLGLFFNNYLIKQKNVSRNTIASYRDAFKKFLHFLQDFRRIKAERFRLKNLTYELVLEFLNWLEEDEHCSISTRNQRLAAIKSFVRYCQLDHPEYFSEFNRILAARPKKRNITIIPSLSVEKIRLILSMPDRETRRGRRDLALLSLMYETGARVQEIIDLKVSDLQLDSKIASIVITGKGNKKRKVPISDNTRENLKAYINENHQSHALFSNFPLFFNARGEAFTRVGVTYILNKYVALAAVKDKTIPKRIHCHMLRHSRAIHLLSAGNPLIVIRDLLGHTDVKTTQIYAQVELENKAKAINSVNLIQNETSNKLPDWRSMPNLMAMLDAL